MIILASSSPRRKELLLILTNDFKVYPSGVEEIIKPGLTIEEVPGYLARLKALDVAKEFPNNLVLGADTIVSIDNEILGKPKNRQDAYNMLRKLSGKTHIVITGFCLTKEDKTKTYTNVSEVTFLELSDCDINNYLDTGEYIGKAGSYAVQGKSAVFISKIKGDFFAVMGLPLSQLHQALKEFE